MSNDVADDATVEETTEVPLTDIGLMAAVARAVNDHQRAVIGPRVNDAKVPLIQAFAERRQSDLTINLPSGAEVGRYKVNIQKDKFEVADGPVFDRYAETLGEIEIVVRRRPAWEEAVLKAARLGPDGKIFDSRTGEEIPGIKFVPGGDPTGTVTWTWKKSGDVEIGRLALMDAVMSGELDDLLRSRPELLPGRQPGASDA
ncbi:hypothetical protein [Streptomyces zaomyceticus]|uniref:hypothetical protein n=1 Tax=Streptomyces zaomyceticus TaxID=68286 RepID=UPI002E211089